MLAKYSVHWACFPKTTPLLYVIQAVACKVQLSNQIKIELQISGNISNIKGTITVLKTAVKFIAWMVSECFYTIKSTHMLKML